MLTIKETHERWMGAHEFAQRRIAEAKQALDRRCCSRGWVRPAAQLRQAEGGS